MPNRKVHKKVNISKELLEELYITKGMATREISKRLGIGQTTIMKYLRKHNIPRRPNTTNSPYYNNIQKEYTIKINNGYFYRHLKPNDPFYKMAKKSDKHIAEHRYVMAKHLNRCLEPWEAVHHKDGNKQNNQIENLMIIDCSEHLKYHGSLRELLAEIKRVRKENTKLKSLLNT